MYPGFRIGDALWMVEQGGIRFKGWDNSSCVFWEGRLSAPPWTGTNMAVFLGRRNIFRPFGPAPATKRKVFLLKNRREINGKQIGHRHGGAQT